MQSFGTIAPVTVKAPNLVQIRVNHIDQQEPHGHPTSASNVASIIVNYSSTRVSWVFWLCMT